MAQAGELFLGLDIGTTKICAIVGERMAAPAGLRSSSAASDSPYEGPLSIVGVGQAPSVGLRKGVVIDIDKTTDAIRQAVHEAETMAGATVREAFVGIAGGHIQSQNSQGVVAIKGREIRAVDVGRVIDAARAVDIADDREILHILPQEYIVDTQDGIREPVGMSGARLEARVHIVTGSAASAQNLIRCAQKAGLTVADIVLEPIASSEAVLSADEKDLGVALVDIGGGTTDLAVWSDGSIVHTQVFALGGDHFTNDLAIGLRTPSEDAERLKCAYGAAMTALVGKNEVVKVPSVGGRAARVVASHLLAEIIEPRAEEMFAFVRKAIVDSGYADLLASGVVLTGGSAQLHGMAELAEELLGLPVRLGVPQRVGGLIEVVRKPAFATGVGLVKYGQSHRLQHRLRGRSLGGMARLRGRVTQFWNELF